MGAIIQGISNLFSGGTWKQSGADIASQQYNTAEAVSARNFTAAENALNRQFNMQEAQKARDWEEHMSNTAYQRAVEDMRAAGLNPYLAYNQGGATSPTAMSASYGSAGSAPAASHSSAVQKDKTISSMFSSALALAGKLVMLLA